MQPVPYRNERAVEPPASEPPRCAALPPYDGNHGVSGPRRIRSPRGESVAQEAPMADALQPYREALAKRVHTVCWDRNLNPDSPIDTEAACRI